MALSRRESARSMLVAWTFTPRMFTQLSAERFSMACLIALPSKRLVARNFGQLAHFFLLHFTFNPLVGDGQALFQRHIGLPAQDLAQKSVVAVASANALWLGDVVLLGQFFAGDAADHVDQVIDAYHLIGAQVEGFAMIGSHQADQTFDAIVHEHVGACLVAIAPDLDASAIGGLGDFP